MTQQKKNAKKLCFAAATGAGAAALMFAALPLFESNNVAVGQIPAANYPAPQMAANPSVPSYSAPAANVGATTNSVAPGVAAGMPGSATESVADLPALRDRAKELQAQLRRMPTSAAEQAEQQTAYNELLDVQGKIQRLEASAGQFSAYRQARDAQALGPSDPNDVAQAGLASNPLAAAQAQNRRQALAETGLNSGSIASRVDAGPGLTTGEVNLLREQKEGLMQQYRQIQQTLRALQPGDVLLADNLRQEQAAIGAQLRDIDARLAAAPQESLAQAQPAVPAANNPFVVPSQNQLPALPDGPIPTVDLTAKMQKVSQAAQLLREAGLVQLANYAETEVPRMADPGYKEQSLVPGAWAEGDGLAEARNNPFQQVGKEDIEKIATKVDDLTTRIDTLAQSLADVEAQLKLLTRNSAIVPSVAPAIAPETAPNSGDAPETTVGPNAAPSDDDEPVEAGFPPAAGLLDDDVLL